MSIMVYNFYLSIKDDLASSLKMAEVGSSSSNIISSTQDSPYPQPIQGRYHGSDRSNRSYNTCAANGQQFYDNSVSMMANTKLANGGAPLPSSPSVPAVQPMVRTLRPHSTPATLIWLEDNYELAEGVCIPRSVLYLHYVDFCANNSVQPVNAASFGKIIRQQFPQLTTRRLGTRGQSRYHYYGIAIRESSAYYQSSYSKKSGQNNVDPLKREARDIVKQNVAPVISSRSRTAAMLPQFPNLKEISLPTNLDKDKMSTFLMMYRTHCQRILDTIIRANFDEVQTFLLHFWQGVPPHLSPVLECNAFVNLIGVCDLILYKTIANVLLPSVLQSLPESLIKMMRQFSNDLENWLRMSLFNLPESLRSVKLELSRRFGQVLRRQTSLNHLSQASRMVVNNNEITVQMLRDWRLIDVHNICTEILGDFVADGRSAFIAGNNSGSSSVPTCVSTDVHHSASVKLIIHFCEQFERLLEEEAQIESYLEWLESLVHKCVLFPSLKSNNYLAIRRNSRHFLLLWSAFGTRVIRDMTLHSAQSFGSFHLLRLMFDDYVLYLIEYLQLDEQMKQFLKLIPTNEPPVFTFFCFNDCELSPSPQTVSNDPSVAIEYESTVSSSTGDHFGSPDNNPECIGGGGGTGTEAEMVIPQNTYSYQNSFPYQNPSLYNSHVEQRPNSWYAPSGNGSHFISYDFEEQQLCHNSGGQLTPLVTEEITHSVNGYSVDTTSMVYSSEYDRQS